MGSYVSECLTISKVFFHTVHSLTSQDKYPASKSTKLVPKTRQNPSFSQKLSILAISMSYNTQPQGRMNTKRFLEQITSAFYVYLTNQKRLTLSHTKPNPNRHIRLGLKGKHLYKAWRDRSQKY